MRVHVILESVPLDLREAVNRTQRLLKVQKILKKNAAKYHKGGDPDDSKKAHLTALRAAGTLSRKMSDKVAGGKRKRSNDDDSDERYASYKAKNKLESGQ